MRGAALIGMQDPYQAFLNYIAGLSTFPTIKTTDNGLAVAEAVRVQLSPGSDFSGSMTGSSAASRLKPNANLGRIIQHAMPSQAVAEAQRAAGLIAFLNIVDASDGAFSALNRNGYTSLSASSGTALRASELLYYTPEGVMRMVPWLQSGPTPYIF